MDKESEHFEFPERIWAMQHEMESNYWHPEHSDSPCVEYVRIDVFEELQNELAAWRSVFPDIAPDRVQRGRSVVEEENAKLRALIKDA